MRVRLIVSIQGEWYSWLISIPKENTNELKATLGVVHLIKINPIPKNTIKAHKASPA